MAGLRLDGIGKSWGDTVAVAGFDLDVRDGEFLVLLGPSGCGKSTTLRMIAGLESITQGTLEIGGTRMNDVDPKDRGVAMVFQNYALYPHKSVFDNMAMALKLQKIDPAEIQRRVGETAAMLGLTDYLQRRPAALSGGQRQRVAIGRAIVRTPEVFLFDEPLSNLDAKLRVRTRMELKELHDRIGVTSIYVTHDQVEAMTLADRIVIMNGGRIAQIGTPREVYDRPADEFVAGFIGSPAMNLVNVEIRHGQISGRRTPFALPLPDALAHAPPGNAELGIRPEHLEITRASLPDTVSEDPYRFEVEVALAELLGADALLNLDVAGVPMLARVPGSDHPDRGERVRVHIPPQHIHLFDGATGRAVARSTGEHKS